MADRSGRSPEEIVRSHIRASEKLLWWHGEIEQVVPESIVDKLGPWHKALAIIPIAFFLIYRSLIPLSLQIVMIFAFVALAAWELFHAWKNRVWNPLAIITDQRIWFPWAEIKGKDIAAIERGFGMNGAITHDVITKNGERHSLPIVNIEEVRDIIERQFIEKNQI